MKNFKTKLSKTDFEKELFIRNNKQTLNYSPYNEMLGDDVVARMTLYYDHNHKHIGTWQNRHTTFFI